MGAFTPPLKKQTKTRGLKEDDMLKIVDFIDKAIIYNDDEAVLNEIASEVRAFMSHRPLFDG